MYTGDPPRLRISRAVRAVVAAGGLALAICLPAVASADGELSDLDRGRLQRQNHRVRAE